jgi:hypothetical protein
METRRAPRLVRGKIDIMSGTNGSSIQRMAVLGKAREKRQVPVL